MGRAERELGSEAPRRGGGRPRGPLGSLGRTFGAGEDPLAWALPLGSVGPVRLGIHLVALLWVGAEFVAWLPRDAVGLVYVAHATAAFLGVSLARELARAGFAAWCGGALETITLWPLGGVTSTAHRSYASGWVEAGGLLFQGIILVATGLGLWTVGVGREALVFNPFRPGAVLTDPLLTGWTLVLWWAYYANGAVLLLNLLAPMFPFDAARILQGAARARLGRGAAMQVSTRVGLLTALFVFVLAAAGDQPRMMAVAALGALATWLEHRRAEFMLRPMDLPEAPEPRGVAFDASAAEAAPSVRRPSRHAGPVRARPTLDEVLERIAREGMGSLGDVERDVLREETERRRG